MPPPGGGASPAAYNPNIQGSTNISGGSGDDNGGGGITSVDIFKWLITDPQFASILDPAQCGIGKFLWQPLVLVNGMPANPNGIWKKLFSSLQLDKTITGNIQLAAQDQQSYTADIHNGTPIQSLSSGMSIG